MSTIYSFAPIVGRQAKILILGSMPGQASLAAGQYYAHQRNAFWPILSAWLQLHPDADYAARITALQSSPIALWDVLKSCKRMGSLDSGIEVDSEVINDFQSFFQIQPALTHIFFNGGKAETSFRRYVASTCDISAFKLMRLPSTSPAHARLSLQEKSTFWHIALQIALQSPITTELPTLSSKR